jgi:hypothetical protein
MKVWLSASKRFCVPYQAKRLVQSSKLVPKSFRPCAERICAVGPDDQIALVEFIDRATPPRAKSPDAARVLQDLQQTQTAITHSPCRRCDFSAVEIKDMSLRIRGWAAWRPCVKIRLFRELKHVPKSKAKPKVASGFCSTISCENPRARANK